MNERLKKLRKELNMTQQEFANCIGTARNNIAGYETGKRQPSDAVISLICKTDFQKGIVNETWLRTGEGEMFKEVSRAQDIALLTKQLLDEEEDSFKNRLISVLAHLPVESWEVLEQIAIALADKKDE